MNINWVAVAAVTEVLGLVAVVVSVVYLALQVRKQTEEARLTATRDLGNQLNEVLLAYISDPELLESYRVAMRDIHALDESSRLRISMQIGRTMRCLEQHYVHSRGANVDEAYVASWDKRAMEIMALNGMQQWWALNHTAYHEAFCEYIAGRIALAQRTGYRSSFQQKYDDARSAEH